jgi:hypothetical protein
MKNHKNLQALEKTLVLAGIDKPNIDKLKILRSAEPDERSNQIVYEAANSLIFEELSRGDLGVCIHVTGEMRALTDPFHRQLCEEMSRRNKGLFKVLFHGPSDPSDSTELIKWNLKRWSSKKQRHWAELLRVINAIANQSVDILSYDTLNEIQYSLFANKYVLLQEAHNDLAESKRVWLLESASINQALSNRAEIFLQKAIDIDETIFKEFTTNLSSLIAYRILSKLIEKPMKEEDILEDKLIQSFTIESPPQNSLNVLEIMRFIEVNEKTISITPAGKEFYNILR